MKNDLISTLSDNLNPDAQKQLLKNASRYNIRHKYYDDGIRFRIVREESSEPPTPNIPKRNIRLILKRTIIWLLSLCLLAFLTIFISKTFDLKYFVSFLIIIGGLILALGLAIVFSISVRSLYLRYEQQIGIKDFESINKQKAPEETVLAVITETFDTLSLFRKERLRQAKSSYNTALAFIITGIIIVFIGVYLLFKKSITEGSITSAVGAISNILGSTILKFYRDTNNRMDLIDKDLFTLNTVKVQYSLIIKISDVTKRNQELSKLIESIGEIKRN